MSVWVEWVEPFGPENEPVYCRVPASTAIAVVRKEYEKRGKAVPDDEVMLTDFIVVNWAKRIEVKDEAQDDPA